ncbi:MAG: SpoIIE family protein phosphatase [Acidiferrobacterales bacterium]|nr:SpoIIE family protein phosphatase [Acidiferrobacterales bacterium]
MLLRTRISLLSVLTVIIISSAVLFASFEREQLIRNQLSDEIIADEVNLWSKIQDEFIANMEDSAWIVRDNRELVGAIENQDYELIRNTGRLIVRQLMSEEVSDRLDILDSDGNLIFSSLSGVFQSPIISEEVAMNAVKNRSIVRGVGNDKQRNTAVVYGFPIINDVDSIVGLGIMSLDIIWPISEMEKLNDASVMILNRRGRLLVSPNPEIWENYGELVDLGELSTSQTISKDDRYFSVTVLPQIADVGSLVGRLVSITEVTEQVLQERKISQLTIVAIVVFTLISLVSIYFYMRYSFASLTEGVHVLEALSRGDLMMLVHMRSGKDEVGQIGNAVNVFRTGMITLNRIRRSRERQRARQERFIYREMKSLADTLDGEEQAAMLKELDKIAQQIDRNAKSGNETESMVAIDPTADDFDPKAIHGTDSLLLMATAFQSMSTRVQDQHQRLRDALATKQAFIALRKELDIATRVQLSLLPHRREQSDAFEIIGGMWPAKEVGGDFFDYFRIDEEHIGMAIADVSGKGVPAALFAVMARTSLRGMAAHVRSPASMLERINNFLESHNDENLFITFFYGILNESTGQFTYANGGHNAPILVNEDGATPLDLTAGMVLGMFDNLNFEEDSLFLPPKSRLVMITDGITEAFNENSEAFGDDRLLEVASSLPDRGAGDDVKHIITAVDKFVGTAPQFDDITCVVLHYAGVKDHIHGSTDTFTDTDGEDMEINLTLKCDLSEIPRIAEEIEQLGESNNWPKAWIFNTNLALDELITNIVSYAFKNDSEKSDISLTVSHTANTLQIVLEDSGHPFDPFLEASTPDLEADMDDRQIGGLGVFFVKTLVDKATYERTDNRNRVTLVIHRPDHQ